ncbi:MAG: VirB4 family type IV secretion system protein [Anaerorhabdus sp.]
MKIRVKTTQLNYDLSKPLKKEVHRKSQELDKTTDPTLAARLRKDLENFKEYVELLVASNDRILDVFMTITITKDTYEELNDSCRKLKNDFSQMNFKIKDLAMMQEELFKLNSPLFVKHGVHEDLIWNLGVPMTTTAFATMWPYHFLKLMDKDGFLLGFEKNNNGIIMIDPFFYNHQRRESQNQNRLNGNIVVFGAQGSGKSTALMKFIRHFIKKKIKTIWIDPENKNVHLLKRYGGEFVNWGTPNNQINIFDLKPITTDEDDQFDDVRWNTTISISNVIDDFKTVLMLYHGNIVDKVAEAVNEIDELVMKTYALKGISATTDFRNLTNQDYPILEDFRDVLIKEIEIEKTNYRKELLTKLNSYIKPLIVSNGHFFNGHTTVKNNTNFLGFGTKSLKNKDLGLRNALNFIMFKYSWAICSGEGDTALVMDEGQEYILEGESAREMSTYARRSRKYNNLFVYASQDPSDLNSSVLINGVEMKAYGTAIMNNSAYKLIMGVSKHAVDSLAELISLNDWERHLLDTNNRRILQGDGLFFAGNQKMVISVYATPKELYEMDPIRNQ